MKKQLLVCALVFVAGSLLAQNIKKFPFQKRHQNHNESSRTTKTSFLKSGNSIKPLTGKYYGSVDPNTNEYQDSTSFVRTYFPDGNLKSEEHTSLSTGELAYKKEYTYDAKGYQDLVRELNWVDTAYQLMYEYGQTKIYDGQNRISTLTYYDLNNTGDTVYFEPYSFSYSNDSAYVTKYSSSSSAPNQLDEMWIAVKENGAPKYTKIEMSFWDSDISAYATDNTTNIVWNGSCDLERLFEVIDYDIFFSSFDETYTSDGIVEEYRGTTSLSTSKNELFIEIKQTLIYVPDYHEAYSRDAKGNLTLVEYEYNYNPVTQEYASYFNRKVDNTYDQDNLLKEVYTERWDSSPEYVKASEYWYTDFVDVAGINNVKSNIVLDLYPNPANAKLVVSDTEKIISLQVQSINGARLPTVTLINNKTAEIETTDLPNGVYLVSTTSAKGVSKAKFIVSH